MLHRTKSKTSLDSLERLWRRVCGQRFRPHSRVMSCRRGVLVVQVDRSEWLYDMYGWKERWLAQLKQHPAGRDVNDIVLRIGQL